MRRWFFALAAVGLTCAIVALAAAAEGPASPTSGKKCVASERIQTVSRSYVEQQAHELEKLKKDRLAARAKFDAATAAQGAAVQRLAQGAIGAAQSGSDAGTDEGGTVQAATAASADLAQALIEWNQIDAEVSCLEKELAEATTSYKRSLAYGWAIEGAFSVAGGADGDTLIGGGIDVSLRDAVFFSEVQFGLDLGSFTVGQPPAGSKPALIPAPDHSLAMHAPLRIYFGDSPVGIFLSIAPGMVFDPRGHLAGAAVPEAGIRLRGLFANGSPSVTQQALLDAKLSVQPWFFLDGSTTAVLFSVELAVGYGQKTARNQNETLQWKYTDRSSPDELY